MPVENGISVQAVRLDHPAKCGDDIAQYAVKESDGVVDTGVYYANLMAYDRHDHTIALFLSGALFHSARDTSYRAARGGRIARTIS